MLKSAAAFSPLFVGLCFAQSTGPAFPAASIHLMSERPSAPPIMKADPERIHYVGVSMMNLISKAYGVYADQVSGPAWLIESYYTLDALLPPETSNSQLQVMLQHLLAERFDLAVSKSQKNFTVYQLTQAQGGHKLSTSSVKEAVDDDRPSIPAPKNDAQGCPILDGEKPGNAGSIHGADSCSTFHGYTIADFLTPLSMMVAFETGTFFNRQASAAHVVDKTGLTGAFDFRLKYNAGARIPGSFMYTETPGDGGLFKAVEKQLGLKLEKSSALLDALVIERCNKVPSNP